MLKKSIFSPQTMLQTWFGVFLTSGRILPLFSFLLLTACFFPCSLAFLSLYSRSKILSRKPQFTLTFFLWDTWEFFLFHNNGDKTSNTVAILKNYSANTSKLKNIYKKSVQRYSPKCSAHFYCSGPFFHMRHTKMICSGNIRHCKFLRVLLSSKVRPTWRCLTRYSIRAKTSQCYICTGQQAAYGSQDMNLTDT